MFSWVTGTCHLCSTGYIVAHDGQSCVENTICGFADADKQAYCRQINDPVTTVHMNGCRILETDYSKEMLTNEVNVDVDLTTLSAQNRLALEECFRRQTQENSSETDPNQNNGGAGQGESEV